MILPHTYFDVFRKSLFNFVDTDVKIILSHIYHIKGVLITYQTYLKNQRIKFGITSKKHQTTNLSWFVICIAILKNPVEIFNALLGTVVFLIFKLLFDCT